MTDENQNLPPETPAEAQPAEPAPSPPPPPAGPPSASESTPDTKTASPLTYKNPTLAAIFSIFPGLGHIYNGLYVRGITFFVIFASLVALADRGPEAFGAFGAFFWFFNLFDSYRQATLINYGYATDMGVTDRPPRRQPGGGTMALGVIVFLLGVYGFLEQYLRINLEWILDLWPFGLMVLGGWLIWSALQEKKRAAALDVGLEDYS